MLRKQGARLLHGAMRGLVPRSSLRRVTNGVPGQSQDQSQSKSTGVALEPSGQCWKCGYPVKGALQFCPSCSAVQKPDPRRNFFQLLDLPVKFDLDSSFLNDQYQSVQSRFSESADKYQDRPEEQALYQLQAALVAKAYKTLSDPIQRAVYLLKVKGCVGQDMGSLIDKSFLLDIVNTSDDLHTANTLDKINSLLDKNNQRLAQAVLEVQEAFNVNDLDRAKRAVARMKYFHGLVYKIEVKKRKMLRTTSYTF